MREFTRQMPCPKIWRTSRRRLCPSTSHKSKFRPRIYRKKIQAAHPDQTLALPLTVCTHQCEHTVWETIMCRMKIFGILRGEMSQTGTFSKHVYMADGTNGTRKRSLQMPSNAFKQWMEWDPTFPHEPEKTW